MRSSDGDDRLAGGRNGPGVIKRQAMSETALRATPSVNIDEFERRLRATGSTGAAQDDPLAELARLLGAEDPPVKPSGTEEIKRVEAEDAKAAPELAPPRQGPRVETSFGQVVSVNFGGEPAPRPAKPPPLLVEPPPYAPEGETRGEAEAGGETRTETATPPPTPLLRPAVLRSAEAAPASSRPRRKVWPMAALIVIGVAGAAGAWAYRGGVPGLTAKVPPLIMAAAGPTKVQPPSQETVSSPSDVGSLLTKDHDPHSTPASVVSSKEQPVDLNERAKAQAANEVHAAAPPSPNPPTIAAEPLVVIAAPASAPAAPQAPSSAAPPAAEPQASAAPAAPAAAIQASPAPSTAAPQPQSAAPATQSAARSIAPLSATPVSPSDAAPVVAAGTIGPFAQPAQPSPFPEPKRVKTVSVRPDGSVIGAQAPAAVQPIEPAASPSKLGVRPSIDASAAEPATPKLDLPAKPPGKATTRVPIAKIDTTVSSPSPDGPLQISPPAQRDSASKKHDANTHVAAADAATPADAAPEKHAKPAVKPVASDAPAETPAAAQDKSVKTAAAALDSATAADAAGGFAVQLAAPHSEAEAQSAATRLQTKFAGELDGLQPVIRKAELKDKTVYRVRIVGLSHAAAISLCEKLKAAGGACFLARE
jgi:hypothetical protein